MRKKAAAFLLCVAVLLGACLLLRVGGAAWKNSQLEAGFTPSPRFWTAFRWRRWTSANTKWLCR